MCAGMKACPSSHLADDLAIDHMEEAATSHSQRIAPFKNGPLAIDKNVLDDANHIRRSKPVGKHLPNGRPAMNWRLGNLMVDGVLSVEVRKCIHVGAIKGLDPGSNKLT